MTPLPTPYDILQIPYFAPEPGLLIWLAVLCGFAVLMGMAFRPRRTKRTSQREVPFPFREAEAAIKKLVEAKTIRKEDIFDLCRKLKRVVHAYEDSDLFTLGPEEFERSLEAQSTSSALSNFMHHIASLERLKYDAEAQESHMRWAVSSLLAALYEYKKSVRAGLEKKNAPASE